MNDSTHTTEIASKEAPQMESEGSFGTSPLESSAFKSHGGRSKPPVPMQLREDVGDSTEKAAPSTFNMVILVNGRRPGEYREMEEGQELDIRTESTSAADGGAYWTPDFEDAWLQTNGLDREGSRFFYVDGNGSMGGEIRTFIDGLIGKSPFGTDYSTDGTVRQEVGAETGRELFKDHDVAAVREFLPEGTTINLYIVGHSHGAAVSAGIGTSIKAMIDAEELLDVNLMGIEYFNPMNNSDIQHPEGVPGRQYTHMDDYLRAYQITSGGYLDLDNDVPIAGLAPEDIVFEQGDRPADAGEGLVPEDLSSLIDEFEQLQRELKASSPPPYRADLHERMNELLGQISEVKGMHGHHDYGTFQDQLRPVSSSVSDKLNQ